MYVETFWIYLVKFIRILDVDIWGHDNFMLRKTLLENQYYYSPDWFLFKNFFYEALNCVARILVHSKLHIKFNYFFFFIYCNNLIFHVFSHFDNIFFFFFAGALDFHTRTRAKETMYWKRKSTLYKYICYR